jgi:alcohol dehydrogenase class IV
MMHASTNAGITFSTSSVRIIHGMSRPIGARLHVPRGMSNAMLCPILTGFSIPGAVPRYA